MPGCLLKMQHLRHIMSELLSQNLHCKAIPGDLQQKVENHYHKNQGFQPPHFGCSQGIQLHLETWGALITEYLNLNPRILMQWFWRVALVLGVLKVPQVTLRCTQG